MIRYPNPFQFLRQWGRMLFKSAGSGALLPFSDDFSRVDGDLGNGWEYTAGKWTISGGAALGTPGMGPDLIGNGDFSSSTGWANEGNWAIGSGVATKSPGTGNKNIYKAGILTTHKWYREDWGIVRLEAGALQGSPGWANDDTPQTGVGTFISINRCIVAHAAWVGQAAADADIDNVTCKLLTTADLFCTRDFESADIDIATPITTVVNTMQGIAIGLDSVATPANALILYISRARLRLDKLLSGVYSNLINSAITYGDGATLRLQKSGTSIKAYYNGVQIGSTQTLISPTDDVIINATRHGMFSTYSGNTFSEFSAINPT